LFSFCPPVFFVFTEVLQEFRRDITRNIWSSEKHSGIDSAPTWREDTPLITGVRSPNKRLRTSSRPGNVTGLVAVEQDN